jgi:hypothetical protein
MRQEKDLDAVLSGTPFAQIIRLIVSRKPCGHELARELPSGTTIFHLKILREAGIIGQDRAAYVLTGEGEKAAQCLKCR